MEQLMGIGGSLLGDASKALRNGGLPCVYPERVGGTGPRAAFTARRTSYRHCWSGHAKGTRAIELPEAPGARGCKRGSTFSM